MRKFALVIENWRARFCCQTSTNVYLSLASQIKGETSFANITIVLHTNKVPSLQLRYYHPLQMSSVFDGNEIRVQTPHWQPTDTKRIKHVTIFKDRLHNSNLGYFENLRLIDVSTVLDSWRERRRLNFIVGFVSSCRLLSVRMVKKICTISSSCFNKLKHLVCATTAFVSAAATIASATNIAHRLRQAM